MKLEKTHGFADDEAIARIRALTDYWDTRHGTRTSWSGNSAHIKGKVKGIAFDGTFRLESGRMVADVSLGRGMGWLAEKVGGKDYVERKIADYLSPDVTLEALQARIRG